MTHTTVRTLTNGVCKYRDRNNDFCSIVGALMKKLARYYPQCDTLLAYTREQIVLAILTSTTRKYYYDCVDMMHTNAYKWDM